MSNVGKCKHAAAMCMLGFIGLLGSGCQHSTAVKTMPVAAAQAGLVDVRALVPDIAQDIRYASTDNFVGVSIDGYGAARCWLREPAAQALQRVEASLRVENLRLQLFDCYRPARAVQHFMRWANDVADQATKHRYYPNLDKTVLVGDYIAPVSGHSRAATVDLTLMRCDAGVGQCEALDMGTPFDFFDPLAHTDASAITPEQRDNRQLLRTAMEREGFSNYPMEWWHYTLLPAQSAGVLDVPIR